MTSEGNCNYDTGSVKVVELHWYEENSIGKKEIRIKRNVIGNDNL